MAQEWARDDEEREWAAQWVMLVSLPAIFREEAFGYGELLGQTGDSALHRNMLLRTAVQAAQLARTMPFIGPAVSSLERSRFGQAVRAHAVRQANAP